MENVQQTVSSWMSQVSATLGENNTLKNVAYGLLAVFLGVYGPRLHPKLPPFIRTMFNHPVFRTVVILIIVYLSSKDLQLTLLITIAFLLVSNVVYAMDAKEGFETKVKATVAKNDSKDIKSQAGHLTKTA
jgi:hypothetical protein